MSTPDGVNVVKVTMLVDGRMDTQNAALYVGLSQKTLAMQRTKGTGPRFIKRGRIFYYKADLDAWLGGDSRKCSTTQLSER